MVETDFERKRGELEIEVREGFSLFLVHGLPEPLAPARLEVLKAVTEAEVSLDFLKLTSDGLSFVVQESLAESTGIALERLRFPVVTATDRSVLSAWSPNLRDEEGMAARIVSAVIATGARLDHISDMHDRILFLMDKRDVQNAAVAIREAAAS